MELSFEWKWQELLDGTWRTLGKDIVEGELASLVKMT
jgi:hypothetical protein